MGHSGWLFRLTATSLVAAGLGLGYFGAVALEPLVHETDLRRELPPCFEIGVPYHHRFRADCVEMMRTPRGLVRFRVNEDRLRDSARARILAEPRRVLVIGDSFAEGWWLPEEQTLSATLGARFPGYYFINAGLRSTGSLQQASILPGLLRLYRPLGVIWVLNDTDVADDRLACALAEDPAAPAEALRFGTQDFELPGAIRPLAEWLGDSQPGRRLRRYFYTRAWKRLTHGDRAARCTPCRGVEELLRVAAQARVPVLPIFLPAGASAQLRPYEGEAPERNQLASCLAQHRPPVPLSGPPPPGAGDLARYYWEGDFHLNPEGVLATVDLLAPRVDAWLRGLSRSGNLAR